MISVIALPGAPRESAPIAAGCVVGEDGIAERQVRHTPQQDAAAIESNSPVLDHQAVQPRLRRWPSAMVNTRLVPCASMAMSVTPSPLISPSISTLCVMASSPWASVSVPPERPAAKSIVSASAALLARPESLAQRQPAPVGRLGGEVSAVVGLCVLKCGDDEGAHGCPLLRIGYSSTKSASLMARFLASVANWMRSPPPGAPGSKVSAPVAAS